MTPQGYTIEISSILIKDGTDAMQQAVAAWLVDPIPAEGGAHL
jgi:hypothetical protein